jgi:hypothetical protein
MVHRSLALSVALAVVAGAGTAGAGEALKPLRVMVYDVIYSTSTLRREHTSGFTGSEFGGSVAGLGLVDRRFGSDDTGTLTVSIVAATRDGGLVADVTFAGRSVNQSTVRVAILRDGGLTYDPRLALSPAATGLLPFLARGLLAERNVNVDSAWTVAARPPAAGQTTYKVVATDGDRATIEIESAIAVRGAAAFAESTQGRALYATELLSPLSLDLHSTVRRDVSAEETDTVDSRLSAKLRSDVFPQARGE